MLAREFGTSAGPVDALGIDQDGRVYVVEAKLRRNADRRKVVAQALDYGAALWKAGADPDDVLARLDRIPGGLRAAVRDGFDISDAEVDAVLERVRATFRAGTFSFVVVMDEMETRLRDLLAYVNQSSTFDLFGVELELYRLEGSDVVIPRLHGAEARKPAGAPSAGTRSWTESDFFPALAAAHGPEAEQAARAVHAWGARAGRIEWQAGKMHGGFSVVATAGDASVDLFKVSEDAHVRVYTTRFADAFGVPPERWAALRERLGAVGVDVPADPHETRKLSVSFAGADGAWAPRFTSAFGWVVERLGDAPRRG